MSTITQLFEIFLDLRRPELAAGTIEIYRHAMGRFQAVLGDPPAAQVKPLDAMRFAAELAKSGLRPATANMYLRAVKTFFRWLTASEQIAKDPFRAVKQQRDTAKGKKVFSPDEIDRLLAACLTVRWRMYVLLAASTGMRRGEILNLTVSEVDYAAGVITLAPKADTAQTWAWQIKDRESRMLPITGPAEQMLLRVHAELPEAQPYIAIRPQRYRRLIAKRDRLAAEGKPLPSTFSRCPVLNFNRDWKGICDRAGVAYRPFHALRGSALSIMAQNGLQPHEIMQAAGHSKVETTYSHYVRPLSHVNRVRDAAFQPHFGR